MKSIVTLLGISILAALVLSGCDKNNPGTPPDAGATNSSMSDVNGVIGGNTNLQITNSVPDVKTNRPNGSNISGLF
ncbi:MAG: hypothetical protein P4N60_09670 [Verrucomicrobiae bacterium]|nr:hypothetical protein [Verrucomicrobiae bacterium]